MKNNIPVVSISGGGHKFIVASVLDEDGNFIKNVFRASDDCPEHGDILASLRREVSPYKARCLGGGKVNVYEDVIALFGESNDFGKEPREETVRLLEEEYPDVQVLILD